MSEIGYVDLQRRFGGRYIARDSDRVIADAATFEELQAMLDDRALDWTALVIEFVELTNVVGIY
jgi:hypothetical protein